MSPAKKNLTSNIISLIIRTVFVLVLIPFYIKFLGEELYSDWIVLYTLPAIFELTNFGINQAVNNTFSIHFNKKIEITTLSISKEVYLERNKKVFSFFLEIKEKYNLSLIFLEDIFCNEKRCFAHKRGVPLYFDDDHMSKEGANLISQKIMDQL